MIENCWLGCKEAEQTEQIRLIIVFLFEEIASIQIERLFWNDFVLPIYYKPNYAG